MKRLLIATALATLVLSTPALADDKDRKGWDKEQKEYAKERREAEKEYWKDRREAEKEYWKDRREADKEYRRWARGDHIPRDYLVETYYVRDYDDYHLAPPPPGYMWVRPYRDDDTYYMVQLATGLISQIFGQ